MPNMVTVAWIDGPISIPANATYSAIEIADNAWDIALKANGNIIKSDIVPTHVWNEIHDSLDKADIHGTIKAMPK